MLKWRVNQNVVSIHIRHTSLIISHKSILFCSLSHEFFLILLSNGSRCKAFSLFKYVVYLVFNDFNWTFPFAADLRQIIRQEMENNRNCNDKQRIRFLISDGIERVKRLDETLDMQGHWFNCNVYMVCLTSCNINPVVTYRINQRRAANIGGSCALAISAWFILLSPQKLLFFSNLPPIKPGSSLILV